ncbi:MAG: flippase-like domain-containing protein [Actinomycetota bacterium]|nr:flippase-like domain-containing protein [Actinomycetota bacterium]
MPEQRVEYIAAEPLPDGLDAPSLRRRALRVVGVLVIVALVAVLAPGLGELRTRLAGAQAAWLVAAAVLELLSCLSYIVIFKPVFCSRMTWRSAYELGISELAVGSLVPAGGAGGLAFGAWALRRVGMPTRDIARATVAFFVLTSAANFVAVVVIGLLMWVGVGPHRSPLLTLLPAALAALAIFVVAAVPTIAARRTARPEQPGRLRRWRDGAGEALDTGVREAGRVLRRRDWLVIVGSLGYWAFDNAVLWACLHAVGLSAPVTLVLMGYLIGQLGALLPIPGGVGAIDGGLLGTLVVYGLPAAPTAAAILLYRVILFWLPLVLGGIAFDSLRQGLNDPDRPDLCEPFASIPTQPQVT